MSDSINLHDGSRLSVPEQVLARRAAGETVLLNLANEQYYGLDGVGSRLWELIEAGITFGQALAALLEEFDVAQEVLRADLNTVLADLSTNGLVLVDAA